MSSTDVYPQLESDETAGLTAVLASDAAPSHEDGARALAAHELAQAIDAEAQRYTALAGRLSAVLQADKALLRSGWTCSRSSRRRRSRP